MQGQAEPGDGGVISLFQQECAPAMEANTHHLTEGNHVVNGIIAGSSLFPDYRSRNVYPGYFMKLFQIVVKKITFHSFV